MKQTQTQKKAIRLIATSGGTGTIDLVFSGDKPSPLHQQAADGLQELMALRGVEYKQCIVTRSGSNISVIDSSDL